MTLEIRLTPEFEEYVRQRVASGRYASASDVVCDALCLLQLADAAHAAALKALQADIARGLADREAGRTLDFAADAFKAEARRRAREELVALGQKMGI